MNDFKLYMKTREKVAGWIYLPIHAVLMSLLILPIINIFLINNGIVMDVVQINTVYYCIGFAYVLIFMMPFLRENFIQKPKSKILTTALLGYGVTLALNYVIQLALMLFSFDVPNLNNEAVNSSISMNFYTMFAVTVIMAPIVEEVLFRGIVFGTIRTKSRVLAYIVSVLVFSAYHLWSYVYATGEWIYLLRIVDYIPAALTLAWTYEKSNSIWCSITLHMIINGIAVLAQASLM